MQVQTRTERVPKNERKAAKKGWIGGKRRVERVGEARRKGGKGRKDVQMEKEESMDRWKRWKRCTNDKWRKACTGGNRRKWWSMGT